MFFSSAKTSAPNIPGRPGDFEIMRSFLIDGTPYYVTGNGNLYTDELETKLHTFPTNAVKWSTSRSAFFCADGGSLIEWTFAGTETTHQVFTSGKLILITLTDDFALVRDEKMHFYAVSLHTFKPELVSERSHGKLLASVENTVYFQSSDYSSILQFDIENKKLTTFPLNETYPNSIVSADIYQGELYYLPNKSNVIKSISADSFALTPDSFDGYPIGFCFVPDSSDFIVAACRELPQNQAYITLYYFNPETQAVSILLTIPDIYYTTPGSFGIIADSSRFSCWITTCDRVFNGSF